MINPFAIGDTKTFEREVEPTDIAAFEARMVHPFYATFALCRDAEWVGRLFVLDMKDEDEEGIGTFVHVEHRSPAYVGERVRFTASLIKVAGNSILTHFRAEVGDRLIAEGSTGQKIIKKAKLEALYPNG